MNSHSKKNTVFIVEDEVVVARDIQQQLESLGYEVVGNSRKGEEAIALVGQLQPDLVLMDIHLAGPMKGTEAAQAIKDRFNLPIVFLTAFSDSETLSAAKGSKPQGYIIKPFTERILETTVQIALHNHHLETQLQRSEARLALIIEATRDGIWERDLIHGESYYSPRWFEMLGWRPEDHALSPDLWLSFVHPDDLKKNGRLMAEALSGSGRFFSLTYRLRHKDGHFLPILSTGVITRDFRGVAMRVAGIDRDLTAEKKAVHADRLESLVTMSGGVAHDLNDALIPILTGLKQLRRNPSPEEDLLSRMEASALKGAEMVRQLFALAKGLEGEFVALQPIKVLNEVVQIIQSTYPKNIRLATRLATDMPDLQGDPLQLRQVLMILCANGRDAMPDGGLLTLEAEFVRIPAGDEEGVAPGDYLCWRVSDTGTGIAPQISDRIFEPFFTTKSRETATGLGLSMARSIVLTHGGGIKVRSSLHLGSAFEVYLPLAGASNGRTPRMDKKKPALSGVRPRVLLVDEDLGSLGFFTSALNGLDYETTRANGPIEALARVAEYGKDLDLVITRQDLPTTDGLSFLRVLKHMLPNVGVIATSGEANEVPKNEFHSPGGTVLLCKPFTQDALLKAIQQVSEKRNYGSSTEPWRVSG